MHRMSVGHQRQGGTMVFSTNIGRVRSTASYMVTYMVRGCLFVCLMAGLMTNPATAETPPLMIRCAVLSATTTDRITVGDISISVLNQGPGSLSDISLDLSQLNKVRLPQGPVSAPSLEPGEDWTVIVTYSRETSSSDVTLFEPLLHWRVDALDASSTPLSFEVTSPIDNLDSAGQP